MAKKADLLQAMRDKSSPSPAPVTTAPSAQRSERKETTQEEQRQVAAHFPAAVQMQLRLLTVERDTTVKGLLAEALNDLFAKYGKPEIAPTGERG